TFHETVEVPPADPDATSGGAEFSEALQGVGPRGRSALDAMRRSREYRVLNDHAKGAKTPRRRSRRQNYGAKITTPRCGRWWWLFRRPRTTGAGWGGRAGRRVRTGCGR